ncbi:hypothetical protein BVY03_03205 [bacterium K02(2017)]|nr:hypothetical protein BVY03_03205 [bacterium K02(2017)]
MKKCERTISIRIILVYTTLFTLYSYLVYYFFLFSEYKIPLGPKAQIYYDNLTSLDWTLSFTFVTLGFLGAIALFFLKKSAVFLLGFSFIINLFLTI